MKEINKMSEQKTFEGLVNKLMNKNRGYFDFIPLNDDYTLFERIPCLDRNPKDVSWLRKEEIIKIHICDPEEFVNSFNKIEVAATKEEKAAAKFAFGFTRGYVYDEVCYRCKRHVMIIPFEDLL